MSNDLITLSVELVKAHLVQNRMSHRDVPEFVRNLHATLAELSNAGTPATAPAATASTGASAAVSSPPVATPAPAATPEVASEPEVVTPEPEADTGPQRAAPVLHEDVSDKVYKGLDPWLAKRINPKMASKLDPKNKIHPTVFPDYIICLEDGEKVKLLRSWVQKRHGLSFPEYIDKWNLPDDYPTAPPTYLEAKRAAAKASGLGVTTRAKRERKAPAQAARATSTRAKASAPKAGRGAGPKADPVPATTGRAARGRRRASTLMPQ